MEEPAKFTEEMIANEHLSRSPLKVLQKSFSVMLLISRAGQCISYGKETRLDI